MEAQLRFPAPPPGFEPLREVHFWAWMQSEVRSILVYTQWDDVGTWYLNHTNFPPFVQNPLYTMPDVVFGPDWFINPNNLSSDVRSGLTVMYHEAIHELQYHHFYPFDERMEAFERYLDYLDSYRNGDGQTILDVMIENAGPVPGTGPSGPSGPREQFNFDLETTYVGEDGTSILDRLLRE